ncbi:hypothetical protein ACFLQY_03465 [Verrucomicrobiota bacterium]
MGKLNTASPIKNTSEFIETIVLPTCNEYIAFIEDHSTRTILTERFRKYFLATVALNHIPDYVLVDLNREGERLDVARNYINEKVPEYKEFWNQVGSIANAGKHCVRHGNYPNSSDMTLTPSYGRAGSIRAGDPLTQPAISLPDIDDTHTIRQGMKFCKLWLKTNRKGEMNLRMCSFSFHSQ